MSNLRRPTQYRTPITAVTETATEKSCGDCSQSHIPFNNVVGVVHVHKQVNAPSPLAVQIVHHR